MNRIKRISSELLEKYPDKFGLDFDANKATLANVSVITSKVLRNELAGYITSHLRKQAAAEKGVMASESDEEESDSDAEE